MLSLNSILLVWESLWSRANVIFSWMDLFASSQELERDHVTFIQGIVYIICNLCRRDLLWLSLVDICSGGRTESSVYWPEPFLLDWPINPISYSPRFLKMSHGQLSFSLLMGHNLHALCLPVLHLLTFAKSLKANAEMKPLLHFSMDYHLSSLSWGCIPEVQCGASCLCICGTIQAGAFFLWPPVHLSQSRRYREENTSSCGSSALRSSLAISVISQHHQPAGLWTYSLFIFLVFGEVKKNNKAYE